MEYIMEFIIEIFGELFFDGVFALVNALFPEKTFGKKAVKIIKAIIAVVSAAAAFAIAIGVSLMAETGGASVAGRVLIGIPAFYVILFITLAILRARGVISKK